MLKCTMQSFLRIQICLSLTTDNHIPLEVSGRGHFFHVRHLIIAIVLVSSTCCWDSVIFLSLSLCYFMRIMLSQSFYWSFFFFFYILEKITDVFFVCALLHTILLYTSSYFYTLKYRSYSTTPNKKRCF